MCSCLGFGVRAAAEAEARPGEEALAGAGARVVARRGGAVCGWFPAGPDAEAVELPCGVVVAAARGVGQRVVGVIDLLELAGFFSALRRVGGDAVGVMF